MNEILLSSTWHKPTRQTTKSPRKTAAPSAREAKGLPPQSQAQQHKASKPTLTKSTPRKAASKQAKTKPSGKSVQVLWEADCAHERNLMYHCSICSNYLKYEWLSSRWLEQLKTYLHHCRDIFHESHTTLNSSNGTEYWNLLASYVLKYLHAIYQMLLPNNSTSEEHGTFQQLNNVFLSTGTVLCIFSLFRCEWKAGDTVGIDAKKSALCFLIMPWTNQCTAQRYNQPSSSKKTNQLQTSWLKILLCSNVLPVPVLVQCDKEDRT